MKAAYPTNKGIKYYTACLLKKSANKDELIKLKQVREKDIDRRRRQANVEEEEKKAPSKREAMASKLLKELEDSSESEEEDEGERTEEAKKKEEKHDSSGDEEEVLEEVAKKTKEQENGEGTWDNYKALMKELEELRAEKESASNKKEEKKNKESGTVKANRETGNGGLHKALEGLIQKADKKKEKKSEKKKNTDEENKSEEVGTYGKDSVTELPDIEKRRRINIMELYEKRVELGLPGKAPVFYDDLPVPSSSQQSSSDSEYQTTDDEESDQEEIEEPQSKKKKTAENGTDWQAKYEEAMTEIKRLKESTSSSSGSTSSSSGSPERPAMGLVNPLVAKTHQMVQLSPGSGVYVYQRVVDVVIKRKSYAKMARSLIDAFYSGEEILKLGKLKNMNPHIRDAITAFCVARCDGVTAAQVLVPMRGKFTGKKNYYENKEKIKTKKIQKKIQKKKRAGSLLKVKN